jgi:hypothetical protein
MKLRVCEAQEGMEKKEGDESSAQQCGVRLENEVDSSGRYGTPLKYAFNHCAERLTGPTAA